MKLIKMTLIIGNEVFNMLVLRYILKRKHYGNRKTIFKNKACL